VPIAITYSVPDISCGHCRAAITREVSTLPGVEAVEVDVSAKTVTLTGEFDDGAARKAIDAAGYEVAA
jgi:copper chaperone CopZ